LRLIDLGSLPGMIASAHPASLPFIPLVLVAVFLLLLSLETALPLRRRTRTRSQRYPVNFALTGGVLAAAVLVVRPVALAVIFWLGDRNFGLLHLVRLPAWVAIPAGLILMDLTFYWWHRANHRFFLLWRFHSVHHLDPDMDITTANRFHFGEILYSTGFRVIQVGLLGVDPLTYLLYEAAYQVANLFQHANLRLPLLLERILNKILVTPRMHGIHHSVVSEEVGSNFSVVFRWWDFLHRTLRLNVPQQDITIGVASYLSPEHNRLWPLVVLPLRLSKTYWLWPNGSQPKRHSLATPGQPEILAG
jgi:sterol desaturase/sphingolipid hydroxylase (fatty acid hydroxylase superfamily)